MAKTSFRIKTLIALAGQYYPLTKGSLIDKHLELLRVTDIKEDTTRTKKHPHEGMRVYISRKSLKHYVEQRKAELSKNHVAADVLTKIYFAIEQIPRVIKNFNKYELEPDPEKHFYIKYYPDGPSIRILCQQTDKGLKICSLHFTQRKKEK